VLVWLDVEVIGLFDKLLLFVFEFFVMKVVIKRVVGFWFVCVKVWMVKLMSVHVLIVCGGSVFSCVVVWILGYLVYWFICWVLMSKYGYWGVIDFGSGIVYISFLVFVSCLDDVVCYEWLYVLVIWVYGSVLVMIVGLDVYFGGLGMVGVECVVDCMVC